MLPLVHTVKFDINQATPQGFQCLSDQAIGFAVHVKHTIFAHEHFVSSVKEPLPKEEFSMVKGIGIVQPATCQ